MPKPIPRITVNVYRRLRNNFEVRTYSSDGKPKAGSSNKEQTKDPSKSKANEKPEFTLKMDDLMTKLRSLHTPNGSMAKDSQIKERLQIRSDKITSEQVIKAAERLGIDKLVSKKSVPATRPAAVEHKSEATKRSTKKAASKPRSLEFQEGGRAAQRDVVSDLPDDLFSSSRSGFGPKRSDRGRAAQRDVVSDIPDDLFSSSRSGFGSKRSDRGRAAQRDSVRDPLDDLFSNRSGFGPQRSDRAERSMDNESMMRPQRNVTISTFKDRHASLNTLKTGWLPQATKESIFNAAKPLGIFNPDKWSKLPAAETVPLTEQWKKHFEEKANEVIPCNHFEEMMMWTNKGQMWHYPIDNQQGMDCGETFDEHVFLERHLEDFPQNDSVRQFMSLVCIGLSNNPYITAREKRDHIEWFREYFETNQSLINDEVEVN